MKFVMILSHNLLLENDMIHTWIFNRERKNHGNDDDS